MTWDRCQSGAKAAYSIIEDNTVMAGSHISCDHNTKAAKIVGGLGLLLLAFTLSACGLSIFTDPKTNPVIEDRVGERFHRKPLGTLATTAERLQPLDFAPGTSFDYSNIGFVVLGEVIERISGQPYSRFMQENVFSPLGMTRTGIEDPTTVEKQMARGYARVDERFADAGYVDLRLVGGAGALHSTVDDLLLLDRALHDGSLLPESLQQRLFTPERMEYAKGWWVQTQFGRRVQWHRGNVQGFVATIVRYPDDGLFVA